MTIFLFDFGGMLEVENWWLVSEQVGSEDVS